MASICMLCMASVHAELLNVPITQRSQPTLIS